MLNKDAVEKALLLGVVRDKAWDTLILHNITKDYFSYANHGLYDYIKEYVDRNEYPELAIIGYKFEIDDQDMREHLEIADLKGLCDVIKKDYVASTVKKQLAELNDHTKEIENDPIGFIQKMGGTYDYLKTIGAQNHSIGLFDNIEETMKLDPNDVISTGFKELDSLIAGWKKGEELIVVAGRTGQGKSWLGLKFALAAALQGYTAGIYSGEMSLQQLQERILCCAKQTYTSTKEDALQFIKENDPKIRILTQKELVRRANVLDLEEMIIRDKLDLLVVDQLSLVDDIAQKPGTPLRQQYGNIAAQLASLSIKYSIPIILLVQLNRQSTQDNKPARLENISESDLVSHFATRVLIMTNSNGVLTLLLDKDRYQGNKAEIKYEIDYGINKYKHIKELPQQNNPKQKAQARKIFGGGTVF